MNERTYKLLFYKISHLVREGIEINSFPVKFIIIYIRIIYSISIAYYYILQ